MQSELPIVDGRCYLIENFIEKKQAACYFEAFKAQVDWAQVTIRLFGRSVKTPRLCAWYGDPQAIYRYSGVTNDPLPWFADLRVLRQKVQRQTQTRFNSVLLNLYRDGQDSMGYHADDEPELGAAPTIASISLGQSRRFILKHRFKKTLPSLKLDLSSGSLLVMSGKTQQNWVHGIAKTRRPVNSRINLTFRWVCLPHFLHPLPPNPDEFAPLARTPSKTRTTALGKGRK